MDSHYDVNSPYQWPKDYTGNYYYYTIKGDISPITWTQGTWMFKLNNECYPSKVDYKDYCPYD